MQTGVRGCTGRRVLGIGAGRVVAHFANLPAGGVPHLVQVNQTGIKYGFGVTPDLHGANAHGDAVMGGAGFAHHMAVLAQLVLTQGLHDDIAVCGAHLNQHTKFFAEQGAQGHLVAPAADLTSPIFGVTAVHAAVRNAITLGHQHVHIQGNAHMAGKRHLTSRCKQAAITAVMVGQEVAAGAQGVHRVDQVHQVLRMVQVWHLVAHLPQRLRQNAAAHAVFATAQVDQNQRSVLRGVKLRCECAAHISQRGKGGHDQRHRRGDFFGFVAILPLRAHRQRIFADRDRNAQRRAQFQPDGLHSLIEGGVFTGLTTRRHPVGGQFDAVKLHGCGQQIGDGLCHRHAATGGGVHRGQWGALPHRHGFTGKPLEVSQCHGAVGYRHLPGAHHLVAVAQATHGAVTNGDQKTLGGHGGVGQHVNGGLLQGHVGQVDGGKHACHGLHIAVHFGRLAQQHVHGHVDRQIRLITLQLGLLSQIDIPNDQSTRFCGHTHHCKRATLAFTQGLETGQRIGGNRHHVALLAFVRPDFLGRHARFFQRYGAQVKQGTTTSVIGQFRESVAQPPCAHIMNRQNRVGSTLQPALVDDLLRAALNLRVAPLHRVKVQVRGVGAGRHGAGGAATHANAHARAAKLDQQAAGREFNLVRLAGINHAQPPGDHDRLVVTTLLGVRGGCTSRVGCGVAQGLLVFTKVTQQVWSAKFVVERSPTQGPFHHDLQRAGNVHRLAVINRGQSRIVFSFCHG